MGKMKEIDITLRETIKDIKANISQKIEERKLERCTCCNNLTTKWHSTIGALILPEDIYPLCTKCHGIILNELQKHNLL